MSPELEEKVARMICGHIGCLANTPSAQCVCRNTCNGDAAAVLKEYGDAARAVIPIIGEEAWRAAWMVEPLEGYPIADKRELSIFNYGRDCAVAAIRALTRSGDDR